MQLEIGHDYYKMVNGTDHLNAAESHMVIHSQEELQAIISCGVLVTF